jgi:putative nucleotidyltransferase with HDIG domain
MFASQSAILFDLLKTISGHLPPRQKIFLVGGAVRDMLLSQPVHDLDFVLDGNAIKIARQVANRLGAAFFILDEQHDAARIIFQQPGQKRIFLDFTRQRGPDLASDLQARDFTINAIALDVNAPQSLIDPLRGASDLRHKLLRACSPNTFTDDPLRIVRGVRFASAFGFRLHPETSRLMRDSVSFLPRISAERLRDEFFKILTGPKSVSAIRILDTLGVLPYTFPEFTALKGVEQSPPHIYDVWDHTLAVVQRLEEILTALNPQYDPDTTGNLALGLLVGKLGRFRQSLGEHLLQQLNPDRSLRALLLMAALYHDIGKPNTQTVEENERIRFFQHDQAGAQLVFERAQNLNLSNVECVRLKTIVQHHLRPILLAQSKSPPSRRAVYRFFKDTGHSGVDVCLLSCADVLATYGHTLPTPHWVNHLDVVRSLLEAWWENHQESITPQAFLNGREIMEIFDLQPGPLIGDMLEALIEAQAVGAVTTRDEAVSYLKDRL